MSLLTLSFLPVICATQSAYYLASVHSLTRSHSCIIIFYPPYCIIQDLKKAQTTIKKKKKKIAQTEVVSAMASIILIQHLSKSAFQPSATIEYHKITKVFRARAYSNPEEPLSCSQYQEWYKGG